MNPPNPHQQRRVGLRRVSLGGSGSGAVIGAGGEVARVGRGLFHAGKSSGWMKRRDPRGDREGPQASSSDGPEAPQSHPRSPASSQCSHTAPAPATAAPATPTGSVSTATTLALSSPAVVEPIRHLMSPAGVSRIPRSPLRVVQQLSRGAGPSPAPKRDLGGIVNVEVRPRNLTS